MVGFCSGSRRRWPKWLPIVFAVTFLFQLYLLIRLDILNTAYLQSSVMMAAKGWRNGLDTSTDGGMRQTWRLSFLSNEGYRQIGTGDISMGRCEEWLEERDKINYSRNFTINPIEVANGELQEWSDCAIGCVFGISDQPDAMLGLGGGAEVTSVLRSMESSLYYMENNLSTAYKIGYTVVMTTSLASDVPVGYFSWAEYDIMLGLQEKTEESLAVVFISNCRSHNFRLEAIRQLQNYGVKIDSYGKCLHNRDESGLGKLETLRHYKFSLAFENSNEEDYVTEKYWQSLVAGAVPVVVGAPNIQDFAPSENSVLHIKDVKDIAYVAEEMKRLGSDAAAYNETLRWKWEGPSDSFKALIDMSVVHSSCRLCIHLATKARLKEEQIETSSRSRPCKCGEGVETIYHIYVRERGKFEMESVFLRFSNLTMRGLNQAIISKFASVNYTLIWKMKRPKILAGSVDDPLRIYRVYPLGFTQREALRSSIFHKDEDVKIFVLSNPCANLEVIFI